MSDYWISVQKSATNKTLKALKSEFKDLGVKVPINKIKFDNSEFTLSKSQQTVIDHVEDFLTTENSVNPLRIIITGTAGSGKSAVIREIYHKITERNKGIIISAPTGKFIFSNFK